MIQNLTFFCLGLSISIILFQRSKLIYLKKKNKSLKDIKTLISQEDYDIINNENKLLEDIVKEKTKEISSIDNRYEKLKKYLGLVSEYQYGILKYNLIKNTHGIKKPYSVACEFIVEQRGKDNVKIKVQDVKTRDGNKTTERFNRISDLVNGWYQIKDPNIEWIKPDQSIIRDINIDNILSE